MATIAENLIALDRIRRNLRKVIADQQHTAIDPGTSFTEYAEKIQDIQATTEFEDTDTWVRPSDWLPMPVPEVNEVWILLALVPNNHNTIRITIASSGNRTINWGDGTSVSNPSGIQTKSFDYNNPLFEGTETADGYRQVLIQITGALTTFDIGQTAVSTAYTLEVKGKLPSCAVCNITNQSLTTGQQHPLLEAIDLELGTITGMRISFLRSIQKLRLIVAGATFVVPSGFFQSMYQLRTIEFNSATFLSRTTNASSLFTNCYNLRTITFEPNTLPLATNCTSMFRYCYSLKTCVFGDGSLPLVTSFSNMFSDCMSLKTFTFPVGALTLPSTSMSSTFSGCRNLETVYFQEGSMSGVNTLSGTFGRTRLRQITFPASAFQLSFFSMNFAFDACKSLESVEFLSDPKIISMDYTFRGCESLKKISAVDAGQSGQIQVSSDTFEDCNNLESITNLKISYGSFSIRSRMSAQALNTFYQGLQPTWGSTIYIQAISKFDPIHDPTIATDKGWTIAL